jgi:hypothetical protein
MMHAIPPEATGLWRREVITRSDGQRDTSTRVFWLQTQHLFADLRIPADRPHHPSARGFADYDAENRSRLAAMQGFAGTFDVTGDLCRWHRELDFHPPGGPPDEARFRIEGDILIETGIEAAYEEVWRRETPPDAVLAGFRLIADAAGPKGMLVLAGDHFIAAVDHRPLLPPAASLAALLAAPGGAERPADLLGMLIAYGRIGRAGSFPWRVELSTFPWLEGQSLMPGDGHFDPVSGIFEIDDCHRSRRWQLTETTNPGRLIDILTAKG